jgi:hypothetical protein
MNIRCCLFVLVFATAFVSLGKGKKNITQVLFAADSVTGHLNKYELRLYSLEHPGSTTPGCVKLYPFTWDSVTKGYTKIDRSAPVELDCYDTLTTIKNGLVKNAYIKVLDLSKLAPVVNHKIVIDCPLKFESCYIGKCDCYNNDVDTIIFMHPVEFRFCTISNMVLTNCLFKANFTMLKPLLDNYAISFAGSQFDSGFTLRINSVGWFNGDLNNKAIDTAASRLFINGYEDQELNFRNCVFNGPAQVFNDLHFYRLLFNSCHFNKMVTFSRELFAKRKFRENPATANDRLALCNIDLGNAVFNCAASFFREPLENINFRASYFKRSIDLFEAVFVDSNDKALSMARFSDSAICILRPENFCLSNLKFNWVSVDRISIPFVDDTGGIVASRSREVWEQENMEKIEKYYGSLKEQATSYYSKQDAVTEKLAQKYDHDKMRYQMEYDWHAGNYLSYFGTAIPEFFVKNGYEGEKRFFTLTVLVVLLFALLFFFFCKKEMVTYFEGESGSEDSEKVAAPAQGTGKSNITFKTYFKGLWLSTIVLISPHFPKRYFKINGIMFGFVIIEWLLGLLMIVLFFVYIAGHYPIVKTLVGI